jgi:hypothetical protein
LPIPRVEGYDLESQNALGRPYTLQTLLPGKDLHWLWSRLNQQQKISAVQQITIIIEKIAALTTAAAGRISVSNLSSQSSGVELDQFLVPSRNEAKRHELLGLSPPNQLPDQRPARHQTPCEYLVDHCERWQGYEKDVLHKSRNQKLWDALIAVAYALERREWLGQEFHLAHGDLFARNLLAEITSPATVKITGIVDWDMACFAPKFVALRAPFWAWRSGYAGETDEDVPTCEPLAEGDKVLKEAFRRQASDDFVRFGLSQEGAVGRKLFRVLRTGLLSTDDRHLALDLVEQWDTLYPEDKVGDVESM